MTKNDLALPCVALRGMTAFPGNIFRFDVVRKKSLDALSFALSSGSEIFLVTQKDIASEDPGAEELYPVGVICEIKQVLFAPDHKSAKASVYGKSRAKLLHLESSEPYLQAALRPMKEKKTAKTDEDYEKALVRQCRNQFINYIETAGKKPQDLDISFLDLRQPCEICDYIASVLDGDYADMQQFLSTADPLRRIERMCAYLSSETNINKLEAEISDRVNDQMDENQKEYYLREQMRAISLELNGDDDLDTEVMNFSEQIKAIKNIDDDSRQKLLKECDRLRKMGISAGAESNVIRTYIETVLQLPWDSEKKEDLDLDHARKILERDHYGLEKIKDKIIESLAVRQMAPENAGKILCLAGPPGTGKTSIAHSLAEAMGRDYVRISLGGVHDEAEIRGHRRTYIGSMPGRIVNAMIQSGSRNPLMLLDEVDKLASDYKGDPSSALLEVLDSEQNNTFADHYIEVPFDLSKVFFITTANDVSSIPEPLLDRMELIELSSYTSAEKFMIAKEHLIKKQMKKHGLRAAQLKITDDAVKTVINDYTREAGVRNLERCIGQICAKTDEKIVTGECKRVKADVKDLKGFLGTPKYITKEHLEDLTGVTNGLAWTPVGGVLLKVEAVVMDGKGNLELTGSLGDVMKESARAAVTYIRSNASSLGVDSNFYKDKDIHIHVPEGATPKDGPSAGVTMATSLISALTGRKVRGNIAMTGEITLTGRVLPIGGLREKSMAAYSAGIKQILIPQDNVADLDEIDSVVRENVEFVPCISISDVYSRALMPADDEHISSRHINAGVTQENKNTGVRYEI
jgi:ATP-dependent Lon protease